MPHLTRAVPVAFTQVGTPTLTPTPFDSTAVSSPEFAAVAATVFAVVGTLIVLVRLRGRGG